MKVAYFPESYELIKFTVHLLATLFQMCNIFFLDSMFPVSSTKLSQLFQNKLKLKVLCDTSASYIKLTLSFSFTTLFHPS